MLTKETTEIIKELKPIVDGICLDSSHFLPPIRIKNSEHDVKATVSLEILKELLDFYVANR